MIGDVPAGRDPSRISRVKRAANRYLGAHVRQGVGVAHGQFVPRHWAVSRQGGRLASSDQTITEAPDDVTVVPPDVNETPMSDLVVDYSEALSLGHPHRFP